MSTVSKLLSLRTAAVLVLAAPAFSQVTQGPFKSYPVLGPIREVLHGDFSHYHDPDAVIIGGDYFQILVAPGTFHAVLPANETGNDIAVLALSGGGDGVVYVSDDRLLEVWRFNGNHNLVHTNLGSGAWLGCKRVESITTVAGGTSRRGLVGLVDNGLTTNLVVLADVDDPLSESVVDLGCTAYELVTLEYGGTDGEEIAITTDVGMKIIETDGTPVLAYPNGDDSDELAVIPASAGAPTDRLALITDIQGHRIYVMDPVKFDGPTIMGAIQVVGAVAGDWNLDGYADLVVSHKAEAQLLEFDNRNDPVGKAFDFTPGDWSQEPVTADPAAAQAPHADNEATPTMVDVDGDGDLDLLSSFEPASELALLRNDLRDHSRFAPSVGEGGVYVWSPADGTTPAGGTLTLNLVEALDAPATANAMAITVWHQADITQPMAWDALHSEVVPAPTFPYSFDYAIVDDIASPAVYYLQIRMLEQDSGVTTTEFSSYVWAFTMSAAARALLVQENNSTVIDVEIVINGGEAYLGDGGGIVPLPCPPCTDGKYPEDPPQGGG